MILDPVNGITSVEFYKKVAKQTVGRSFLYLFYLAFLFAITTTVALKVRAGPLIDETFRWLEKSMPRITVLDGKLSSDTPGPVTVRHPENAEVAVTVDTARLEAVTPELMEKEKVLAYVTGGALYVRKSPGKLEVYDFSKAVAKPGDKPLVIDGTFYRKAEAVVNRVIYPFCLVLTLVVFLFWKSASTCLYSLLAVFINSAAGAKLDYKALWNITLYAQTLIIILQAIFLFMPSPLPASQAVASLLTGVYIWLAVRRNMEPAVSA